METQEQALVRDTFDRIVNPPEVLTLKSGYAKSKEIARFRRFTMADVRGLDAMSEVHFEDKVGLFRKFRRFSSLKTWKRDPDRFECSFKYGLYESVRMDVREMLGKLLVRLD